MNLPMATLPTPETAAPLSPDEIQGGTFTVSNNGSAGSVLTAPIINQPQVAIVSTDAIIRKPVVADLPDGSEGIAIHPVGNLAMSWDHRAFDGERVAALVDVQVEVAVDLDVAVGGPHPRVAVHGERAPSGDARLVGQPLQR